jgi:hypothetical protein
VRRLAAAASLLFIAAAAACPALAQSAVPSASALPAPAATPSPAPVRSRLFVPGPQFISVGITIAPRVSSEFAPPGTTGVNTSFALWNSGETTILGRFHVASYTDYRQLTYPHAAAYPVTTVGGSGSTIVPAFNVHEDELENGGGIRVLPNVYAGLGFIGIQGNVGYPQLHGIGEVLMLQPAAQPIIAPYARAFYSANLGGNYTLADFDKTALTYRGWRYHAGVLIREPGTKLALDIGYAGERLLNRTNAPATLQDSMITLGFDLRF